MSTQTSADIESSSLDRGRLLTSIIYPLVFVLILWGVKIGELVFDVSFRNLGIFPLSLQGLPGILLAPLVHADFSHLISNSFPLLVLGSMLFYFYRQLAPAIFILSVLITGFWVWIMARDAWHIGASGLVYSLAAFLFTSGVIRRHPRLMALSLIVVFLYGGMVWGVFPLRDQVSWESHLMGMISGVILAIYFRQRGPRRKLYSWELEELEQQQKQQQQAYPHEPENDPPRGKTLEEVVLREPLSIHKDGHPEDDTLARIMNRSFSQTGKQAPGEAEQGKEDQ